MCLLQSLKKPSLERCQAFPFIGQGKGLKYMRKDREKGKEERVKQERERSPRGAPPSFPCRWALVAL
jgi:hypothetical protein